MSISNQDLILYYTNSLREESFTGTAFHYLSLILKLLEQDKKLLSSEIKESLMTYILEFTSNIFNTYKINTCYKNISKTKHEFLKEFMCQKEENISNLTGNYILYVIKLITIRRLLSFISNDKFMIYDSNIKCYKCIVCNNENKICKDYCENSI